MSMPAIQVNGFYAKNGSQLVMDHWELAIGKAECTKTAMEIVESNPDKESLVAYIADILMGVEYLKLAASKR